jgi:hypothetical protein
MNISLTGSNNILLIGKKSLSNDLLANDLINQITSLNNIEKKYTFTHTTTQEELTDIFEKQIQSCSREPVLIYLNDCIDSEIHGSEMFKNLILNGRNFNIFIVLFVQYPIYPEIKSNFDLVFICEERTLTIVTKLYNLFWL